MMKKFRLLVLAFAAMLAGTQAGVAQNWTGKTADDLKSATRDDINTDSEDDDNADKENSDTDSDVSK